MYSLSSDSAFAFQLEVLLSLANGGGVSPGEVLRAASQIKPGEFESFYSEFKFLADQMHDIGVNINADKYPVSARETFFRAAAYYRAADFYIHGNPADPRIQTLWDSQLSDFDAALHLLPVPGERYTIKGDGFDIPIIFYKSNVANDTKVPTIVAGSGYDGTQEDIYHGIGKEIVDRGYNLVTYEGPGQPTVRRQQNIGFIPDWWNVVTPVVDYLTTRPDVDTDRLALLGLSFGGTLAPRAASKEHRFSAVLAIDGLWSLQQTIENALPAALVQLFTTGNATAFDTTMDALRVSPKVPTELRWLIDQGTWSFNTTSPYDWFNRLGQINLDGILEDIDVPIFIGSGQNDNSTAGQPQIVVDELKKLGKDYTYHQFKTNIGAGEHCQVGAEAQLAQVTMDWLAQVFESK